MRRLFSLAIAATLFTSARAGEPPSSVQDELMKLKTINYYPARSGRKMWSDWQPEEIERDLAVMASLHASAVRIALPTSGGFPQPPDELVQRFRQFIDLAAKHNLRVKVALFAFFKDYRNRDGSKQWADAVLTGLKDDPRIAYIDLQNEINRRDPEAIVWAAQMLPHLHELVGNTSVTVSLGGGSFVGDFIVFKNALSAAAGTTSSASLVDFYEMHYYARAPLAYANMTAVRDAVAPVPLYVGEFGTATRPGHRQVNDVHADDWWESVQDQYYRSVLYATRAAHLPAPAAWNFIEFDQANLPAGEWSMGIFRGDRSPKPAARSLARFFENGAVDLSFNNGFEGADSSSLPLNWNIRRPEIAKFARDTSVRHSGVASASISQSGNDPRMFPAFTVSPVKFIEPGHNYHATVWARGRNVTGSARLVLAWFDPHGKLINNSFSSNLPHGDSDWTQLQISAAAPQTAGYVEVQLSSYGNSGTVWFDDVTFE